MDILNLVLQYIVNLVARVHWFLQLFACDLLPFLFAKKEKIITYVSSKVNTFVSGRSR